MPSDQRDPELWKLAQRIAVELRRERKVGRGAVMVPQLIALDDNVYDLLQRGIIEVGPGLFHD